MFLLLLFQGGPVEILPFLYLGSAYHASKCEFLANLHITALLNVSRKSSESFKDQYCYKWIPVEDSHTADISSHFQEAIDFIGRFELTNFQISFIFKIHIGQKDTLFSICSQMSQQKFKLPPFSSISPGRGISMRKEGRGTCRARSLSFSPGWEAKEGKCCLLTAIRQTRRVSWLALFSFQSKHRRNFSMTGSKEVWLNNTKIYLFL